MKLKELIETRYSVRAFMSLPVEKEKIEYILECARLSPSACNKQPWKFYVVQDKGLLAKIHKSYDRDWFKAAPTNIIVCEDTSASWKRAGSDGKDHADIDAAIAAEHICLSTAEIGLGTCWICNFDPEILSGALNLPAHIVPVAIFPIGYIDEEKSRPAEKLRKPLSEITEWI
ncbi:nitroreductase family protein [Dysgonomonas sp. 511]|uniref:nitroreductase family protein n=1 Tax=Dysgonomonas sp. 511 TaxID=2302930 RepID=UPI0013D13008|nr:nitroreductase family protein [Dysgonomonas sp. 511]NDV79580.1 nitroreductase [Dysgonomonas sp. 511]